MRFVLGGADTEMNEVALLLADASYSVEYANINGRRVNRAQAYEATHPKPEPFDVWVECSPEGYTKSEMYSLGIDLVDHHQPGDFGYSMPPTQYWEASSLGQVCIKVGIEPNRRLTYIAAADHCLLPAYHNQCPEVDREDFLAFRMKFFEKFDTDPWAYLKRLHKEALTLPIIDMLGAKVRDISTLTPKHSKWLADMSCCFNMKTVSIKQKKTRYKMFVSNLSVNEIDEFCNVYAHSLGKVLKVYGDPKRQFAAAVVEGSYVSED